ncbi:MAG: DUF420 domain-containing protein [Polyangiaceae bacterium]
MVPHGFLGTRADLLVDLALVVFVVLPIAMPRVFKVGARGQHGVHRALQLVLFLLMTVAVSVLEVDIRLSGGTRVFAAPAGNLLGRFAPAFLLVHIGIAVATWLTWLTLVVHSARRFRRGERSLPGPFSSTHRQWGKRIWYGLVATATTGTTLYIATFAR